MLQPEPSPTTDKPIVAIEIDEILTTGRTTSTYTFAPVRPGARDFLQALYDKGIYIVIWTERCNTKTYREVVSELRRRVLDWLTQQDLRYHHVYVGTGKPKADLFILPNCRKLAICEEDAEKLADRVAKAAENHAPTNFTPPPPVESATPPHGAPQFQGG